MTTSPALPSEIWFLTGSQALYGPETLDQVAEQSRSICERVDAAPELPVRVVWKPVLLDADSIRRQMLDANSAVECVGRDRVDAHLLAGQDVDRRTRRARQAVAAPAHPGGHGAPVVHHRHGLHEPQPGRARGPRVRLHPVASRRTPQDRRRPRRRTRRQRAGRRVGPRCPRPARAASAPARPVRRQHARCRRDRRRQGRGSAALRGLGEHLRGERPRDGRRRGAGRRHRQARHRVRRHLQRRGRAPAGCRAARVPAVRREDRARTPDLPRPRAVSVPSPPTSRTSEDSGNCRVSPSSG